MEQRLQSLNASQRMSVWAERISSCRNSGMTVREWCNENQLSQKTYYYWQRRLFKIATEQQRTFAEVTPEIIDSKPNIAITVRFVSGRMEADIYSGADTETISTVLNQMKYAK